VTCPSLLRRSAVAEIVGDLPVGPVQRVRDAAEPMLARLRRDDTATQFARFLLVGVATTAVYALFFVGLERVGGLDYLPAHLAATTVSTALANELHRRLTFHAEDRVSWLTAQWEAGGVTVIGLVTTSSALRWLDAATGTTQPVVQVAVVVTVTAVIGALRFIALRWIFRPHAVAA
jgi:putative flippase GtrA